MSNLPSFFFFISIMVFNFSITFNAKSLWDRESDKLELLSRFSLSGE